MDNLMVLHDNFLRCYTIKKSVLHEKSTLCYTIKMLDNTYLLLTF